MDDGDRRLAPTAIEYLARAGEELTFGPGEVIIRRGDPGDAVYVVLEGRVEVHLRAADGRHLSLATLGPGEMFGELSVLRNAATSADVRALDGSRVIRYPAELFPVALTECAELREHLVSDLAHRMHATTAEAWGLYKKAEGFANLSRPEVDEGAMVAVSARMRAVKRRLARCGESGEPVVIVGEPGTGRRLAARLVHGAAGFGADAQVIFDCRETNPEHLHAALFGISMTGDPQEGSGCFGALHLAHGGSLLLANLDALPREEQVHLARYLGERRGCGGRLFPDVLIIGTVRELGDGGVPAGLVPELAAEIPSVVELPPLSRRPREILPLARKFLEEAAGRDAGPRLSRSAEHALVDLDYGRGNVEELRQVIELAVRCSAGDEIRAEHILAGLGEQESFGVPIGQPPWLTGFLRGPGLPLLKAGVLAGFLVAIGAAMLAPGTAPGVYANAFVWNLWEPVVFASFLLVGALWCTGCPLSTAGRLAGKVVNLGLAPPAWLTGKGGPWLPAVGFVVILLVERVFHMDGRPVATGAMLLALMGGSVILSVLYRREVWCRHVCPLGGLAVALAPAAPLAVGADSRRCASTCTTHECFKGTATTEGCPVFHHPLMVSEAHHCKLCGSCLVNCPHGSATLYVRPPLKGAWRLGGGGSYPLGFALVLLLVAPLYLVARDWGPLQDPGVLTMASVGALGAAFAGAWGLGRWLGGGPGAGRGLPLRIGAALAVLAWGPLMADQLANVGVLSELKLSGAGAGPVPLLLPAQVLVVVLAALLALVILAKVLAPSPVSGGAATGPLARAVMVSAVAAYTVATLMLVG